MRNRTFHSLIILSIFLLSSCTSTATNVPVIEPTAAAPSIPAVIDTPLPISTEAPVSTAVPIAELELAKYILNTNIDYDAHTITVDESIYYPNRTASQLNTFVLAVVPNLWAGSFNLTNIEIDDAPTTTYSLEGQKLEIALSSLLQPGSIIKIDIQYTLDLPFAEQEDPNISRPRIYGYTTRQMNLTNWYPFVVPYINGEWVLHEPWVYGEHLVYDSADYEVNISFTDFASAPIIAASGFPEQKESFIRYTIDAARTFALSASREFQVSTLQVGDVTVSSYYLSLIHI